MYHQLDVYEVLDAIEDEAREARNDARRGKSCEDCPDPALCQAENECGNNGGTLR